jgi:hypothetical protein
VAIEHDDQMDGGIGGVDWDAAFEALVAPLRPSRVVRLGRAVAQIVAALTLFALGCWMLVRVVVQPMRELGRPWF